MEDERRRVGGGLWPRAERGLCMVAADVPLQVRVVSCTTNSGLPGVSNFERKLEIQIVTRFPHI